MRICKLDKTEQIWGRGGPAGMPSGNNSQGLILASVNPGQISLPGAQPSVPGTTQPTFSATPAPSGTNGTTAAPATPDYASMCPPGTTFAGVTVNGPISQNTTGVTVGTSPSVNSQVASTNPSYSVSCPANPPASSPPATATSTVSQATEQTDVDTDTDTDTDSDSDSDSDSA